MSLPPEVLKKVRLLEIQTRKLVNNQLAGEYHTAFKGQGMTFSDFREYVPGDDVRAISWPLTARTGKTYIKKFEEERELTVLLVVDISASTDFGTGFHFKGEVMTHLAALLSLSAEKNGDQVGLVLFSDHVEHYVPPKKGRGHVHRLLRDLYFFKPQKSKTDLGLVCSYLQGLLKKRACIFVMSDFWTGSYETSLKLLGKKHDVVACVIRDSSEIKFPSLGLVDLFDPESGEVFTVDSSSAQFQKEFQTEIKRKNENRDRVLRQSGVERIDVLNTDNFAEPLVQYFRQRKR